MTLTTIPQVKTLAELQASLAQKQLEVTELENAIAEHNKLVTTAMTPVA